MQTIVPYLQSLSPAEKDSVIAAIKAFSHCYNETGELLPEAYYELRDELEDFVFPTIRAGDVPTDEEFFWRNVRCGGYRNGELLDVVEWYIIEAGIKIHEHFATGQPHRRLGETL